ncbi:MAG: alpha/beta fold hydrolase [Gammaproteobacteria bacterium]
MTDDSGRNEKTDKQGSCNECSFPHHHCSWLYRTDTARPDQGDWFFGAVGSGVRFRLMEPLDLCFSELGDPHSDPLIILHGFFASSRNWRSIADKLSGRFHVYVPDLRNHGASPHHPWMDYPSMAADVLRFVDRHELAEVSLLGHSMGGKTAMWFALNYPVRITKLVIVDIAPVSYSHSFDQIIGALKSLPLPEMRTRKQAEEWLAESISERSYRQFLLQNLILFDGQYQWRIDLDIFQRMAPHIVAFPDTERMNPFTGKSLFIAGENSDFVKMEDIRPLFPEAELTRVPDAGHWLHVQQPEMFIEKVGNFLKF